MKMLAIVGSMRKKGSTNRVIRSVLESAKKTNPQIKTKVLQMSDLKVEPCRACYDRCSEEPYKCVIEDDDLEKVFQEMKSSQAVVIGSPLYFKIPSRLTAFMERLAALSYFYERRGFKEPHPLNEKPCGLVAVSGGDDPRTVLEQLLNFALSLKMTPIFLKYYPYYGVAGKGKIEKDEDLNPIGNARILGKLLAKAMESSSERSSRHRG
jgi:multimeric flavodoxin WrbA